jgi:virginiamycin B lyase
MARSSILALTVAAVCCVGLPARSQEAALPDGAGKDLVATACTQCHALGMVTGAGHTRADWETVLHMMVNDGAQVPADQVPVLAGYLAANFPQRPEPPAVLVPGAAQVTIQEWLVPTPGSRPHDPMAASDGSLWYSGQMANVLGRLDPSTGTFREFHLTTPQSGPHGLVEDGSGRVWFTANFKAYIGRLDPKTGDIVEYPTPGARDPHTPIFDQHGILWFTAQGADMVGRLDPKTGSVKLVKVPTPKANPYGMVVSSKGVPFFVEFGANKVGRIDPQTMAIQEYELPDPAARPRRVAIAADDIIWYSDYGRGYLGRLDPATGKVTEWPSPGGPKSRPYGIAIIDGIVWYSESGVAPNTLVRFDPGTATFQTWAIPSGGGVVRNMMKTKDGHHLVMACSGVNRVALVTIK